MGDPLVSVVIPCYRQAHLLAEAVDSALAQSYPATQVVVVNDGSDDNTDEVATRYAGRIVYVRQRNGGLPAARNAGIRAAAGQFLIFLDADDLLERDAVRRLIAASDNDPACFCVMGFRYIVHRQGEFGRSDVLIPADSAALPHLLHCNIAPPHAFLVPRQAVASVGMFDERLRACEDWDLWLKLLLAGLELKKVDHVGAYYRLFEGSMSTDRVRMLRARVQVLQNAHSIICSDSALTMRWGRDLLEAVTRVYRRCIIRNAGEELLAPLEKLLGELPQVPGRAKSWRRRIVECLFGRRFCERVSVAYMRRVEPGLYRRFATGFH